MTSPDMVIVLTRAPDDECAEAWARTLVDERLEACVNVHGPGRPNARLLADY